jgi:hypothetical protein
MVTTMRIKFIFWKSPRLRWNVVEDAAEKQERMIAGRRNSIPFYTVPISVVDGEGRPLKKQSSENKKGGKWAITAVRSSTPGSGLYWFLL